MAHVCRHSDHSLSLVYQYLSITLSMHSPICDRVCRTSKVTTMPNPFTHRRLLDANTGYLQ